MPIASGVSTSYPHGWFQVGYSSDLVNCAVQPLKYFDHDLVLFRTASGTPHVFSGWVAHLGAHLGYGGTVEGNCLRCPTPPWGCDTSVVSAHQFPMPSRPRTPRKHPSCRRSPYSEEEQ